MRETDSFLPGPGEPGSGVGFPFRRHAIPKRSGSLRHRIHWDGKRSTACSKRNPNRLKRPNGDWHVADEPGDAAPERPAFYSCSDPTKLSPAKCDSAVKRAWLPLQ